MPRVHLEDSESRQMQKRQKEMALLLNKERGQARLPDLEANIHDAETPG